MKKVVKFGGSSLADAGQFKKAADIIHADEARVYVVPSAPGKRNSKDTKVTDMLIKAYRNSAHTIFERKNDRFEMRVMLIWALLASCDAVAAGIGFGFLVPALVMTVVTVAAATALTVAIGLICGFLLGCGPMNKCVAIGGALVIIGGVDVLLHYIMIR